MSTVPSAAAIAAYDFGSSPCSCTSRAPNSESTIAIITNPARSRTCGEPRRLLRCSAAGRRVREEVGGTVSSLYVPEAWAVTGVVCVVRVTRGAILLGPYAGSRQRRAVSVCWFWWFLRPPWPC